MQKNLSFMSNKKQNEELQSRREFFKKAAKAALPVVGAVVLSSLPNIMQAAETGCTTCTGSCLNTCTYSCSKTCQTTCRHGCQTGCKMGCRGGAYGG